MEATGNYRFNEEEVAEMQELFAFFDKDNSGQIPIKHLGQIIRTFGQNPTDADLQRIQQQLDRDGNGLLNFDEFLGIMTLNVKSHDSMVHQVREAFRVFDGGDNGLVSIEELAAAMTSLGDRLTPEEMAEMVKAVDADENGMVNYEEFMKMLMMQ